jgi:outer membrane murein-binding lipoprotein Lpp
MKVLMGAALSAADSAAHYAARSAADSAAHYAARSAYSAARSAGFAAESGALSALSAADSAASWDADAPRQWARLWGDVGQPEGLRQGWETLQQQWAEDTADWSFWIAWYERILNGDPMDWRLIFRIATEVTEEQWEAGAARVAERIADIRRDFEGPSLDKDALRSHLNKVVQFPEMHADAAESASKQIEQTIAQFKREAETNRLPDGFEAFEKLPSRFWQISVTLRAGGDETDKVAKLQAEVVDLNAIIQQLRLDLGEARSALADARLNSLEAQQVRTFGERLQTTLTNVTLVGSLGVNALLFLGIPPEDWNYQAIKDALQATSQQMRDFQPKEATDALPPTVDI